MTPAEFESGVNNILDSTKPKGVDGSKGITKAIFKQIVVFFKNLLDAAQTAATAAINAASSAGYKGLTSSTSLAIATGSKTFTTNKDAANTAFTAGQRVRIVNSSAITNFFEGVITSFTGTTMVVSVDLIGGSGTNASWSILVGGEKSNVSGTANYLLKFISGTSAGNSMIKEVAGIVSVNEANHDSSSIMQVEGTLSAKELALKPTAINSGVYTFIKTMTHLFEGSWIFQAGGGSSSFGGGLRLFGHSHATKPGSVTAGISAGSGGKFRVNNWGTGDGTDVFSVNGNDGSTYNNTGVYGTISDIRLKENVLPATPKLQKLLKVDVVTFNLIDQELRQIGVIADQLEEVFPGLIEIDETSEEKFKQVKFSVFLPIIIKSIQELNQNYLAEVDLLKEELSSSNARIDELINRLDQANI
ncbi:tail fiber domain-containing protein [Aquirufa nivalisilvae]